MEPNRREFIKQCAFQKFCNTVLHNEACDAHKELHRHKAREITFSDLTLEEARQLHTFDEYFKGEIAFERAGKKITPKLLLEAIRTLPEEKRKAVLLYYFEGMNDTEIAELFNTTLKLKPLPEDNDKALTDIVRKVKEDSIEHKMNESNDIMKWQELIQEKGRLAKLHISI